MFFITCFSKLERDNLGYPSLGASRVMGFYSSYDCAKRDLYNNNCDMRECLYDYAVIEEIPEGIYPVCNSRTFFKFDEEKQGFFEIEEPEILKSYINIALG